MAPKPQAASLALHLSAIVLLILWSLPREAPPLPGLLTVHLIDPHFHSGQASGGTASGPKATPKGVLPPMRRVFLPPAEHVDYIPKLAIVTSIDAPQLAPQATAVGLPEGVGSLSGGLGDSGGIGEGGGLSVGKGRGQYGDGGDWRLLRAGCYAAGADP